MARTQIKLRHPITELELDLDENSLKLLEPVGRIYAEWGKENECTNCSFQPWFERDIHTLNFCPNCGADMRENND